MSLHMDFTCWLTITKNVQIDTQFELKPRHLFWIGGSIILKILVLKLKMCILSIHVALHIFQLNGKKAMADERKAEQVRWPAGCIYADGCIEVEPGRLVLQHNY